MTVNTKLRGFSIAFVGLALYLLLNEIFTGDRRAGDSWLVIALCMITGVIEIVRLELRNLRSVSNDKNSPKSSEQE